MTAPQSSPSTAPSTIPSNVPRPAAGRNRKRLFTFVSIGLALVAVAAVYLVVRGTDDGASNDATDDATDDAGTTGATCIDDAAHVIDEEAGLCFTLPEGWTRLSEEEMTEQEFEVPTTVVSSPGGEASMLVLAGYADEDVLPEDEVAVSINAFVDAGTDDAPEIEPVSGTVDGYPSATASGSHDILGWMSTTVVKVEGRIIVTRSSILGQEPELIAQIEAIQESFSLT